MLEAIVPKVQRRGKMERPLQHFTDRLDRIMPNSRTTIATLSSIMPSDDELAHAQAILAKANSKEVKSKMACMASFLKKLSSA